ncbi:YwhD family protein [Thalassobacillus sp. CUG 92003]|uniref:YwhD family protein n=1 Tax=Thalassobacillus sp. CUG 92003 TaxID=2736641 RepID=UPI0015E78FE5|nr:YwhD family protein [Thalassobacillus sp. CUG 92003]
MKEFDQFKNDKNNTEEEGQKKKNQFTILKDDSTDGHGGYGVGSVSLENVSPVIVDPNEEKAYIDMGALHARSAPEKRIKFIKDRSEVPNGKIYWIVWVTVDKNEKGGFYAGVGSCQLVVDREIRRGFKSMPEHVNNMDRSLKGQFVVDHMDDASKQILGDFLRDFDPELWENSAEELKQAFD